MQLNIDKYELLIHAQPLVILERFTQYKRNAPESGGIIVGKIIHGQINIFKLSTPTSFDFASRMNFERNKISAQIILDYEFQNSNGQMIYLGEWHTHPEPFPTPSPTDLSMLKSQFKNNNLNMDFLLLLIKGTKGLYLRVIYENGFKESKISL